MQLKQTLKDNTPRYRFHLLRRLSKVEINNRENESKLKINQIVNQNKKTHNNLKQAAKWSDDLVALCQTKADSRTQLEAEAYAAWMNGNVNLESEKWQDAAKFYTQAK